MEVKDLAGTGLSQKKAQGLRWVRPVAISAMLSIPCFWQPIVSGKDLQSHLYNAWLAELIGRGSIHGLWIGNQSTNVAIDSILPYLLTHLGVSGAERAIATALVLVLFWGALRFISAIRGHTSYWLVPWLAILCYGAVFQLGLLNYYLSCGVAFWLLAICWRPRIGWRMLSAAPLLVLAWLAHPLPVLWLSSVLVYRWIAHKLRARSQVLLFLASIVAILLARSWMVARYITEPAHLQLTFGTGPGQAILFDWRYLPVAGGFLLFSLVLLCAPENRRQALTSVLMQIYFLTVIGIIVSPSSIRTSISVAAASMIPVRLSLLSGVLLLAILSRSVNRKWFLPAGLLAASVFFAALYFDIGREARDEARMEKLIAGLPAGQRVLSFADDSRVGTFDHRLGGQHLLDRACLGRCFDYMNYEPSTGQFRIHAAPGNPVVLATYAEFTAMNSGTYVVKASDLPLYALIRCGPTPGDIFLRSMEAGDTGAMLACPDARPK